MPETQNSEIVARIIRPLVALVLVAIMLYVTGIGCPIKFATGISCPGCGMTRAWVAALHLRFGLAMAYHPLFWSVPLIFASVGLRSHLSTQVFQTCMVCFIAAFIGVWLVRLVLPHEANVLFSGLLTKDVVSIEAPMWFTFIRSLALP